MAYLVLLEEKTAN